ncbi:MAG: hypothetical protein GY719_40840 [bacterium]|nr:hypothetical protein [bacterium]
MRDPAATRFKYSPGQILREGDIDDRYVRAPPAFFKPSLFDVTPPRFESPPIVDELVVGLRAVHLLVLGGRELREKAVFARHLAWRLADEVANGDTVPVLQWHPTSNTQRLEDTFERNDKKPIVFVFPDLRPQNFGHDLRLLHEAVESQGHFAIIATDSSLEQWTPDGQELEHAYWKEYSEAEVYEPDYLTDLLAQRLDDAEVRIHLPSGLLPEGPGHGAPLVAGGSTTLREAARRLRTPTRVRSFVAALTGDGAVAEAAWIEEKLVQLGGDGHAVQQWYRRLPVREQLLAFGLALFAGLFEDQVFAALEVLVDAGWRSFDPELAHFDYHELAGVAAYFHGLGSSSRITRIETGSPEHRHAILCAAWKLHRRRMLVTLPLLVNMARSSAEVTPWTATESSDEKPGDGTVPPNGETGDSPGAARTSRWGPAGRWSELFGSPQRCVQLRHTVSETLSRIGIFSLDVVEHSLVELAQSSNIEVQAVAALAMASWRGADDLDGNAVEPRLFQNLKDWLDESSSRELLQRIVSYGHSRPDHAHMRATVALTVSYAALQDPPDQLAPPLCELLEKLLGDEHPIVRERFSNHTLPLVVAHHFGQLEPLLRRQVLRNVELLMSLVAGLAAAVEVRPRDAIALLSRWYDDALEQPRQDLPDDQLTTRETMLFTVILTYARLGKARSSSSQLSPHKVSLIPTEEEIFDRFRKIMAREPHPSVREVVLHVLEQRVDRLKTVASFLQDFVCEVTLNERDFLVRWLTDFYLRQRREQKGGERNLTVDGKTYPTWKRQARPQTEVEELMYTWLQDSEKPVSKQLAMDVFVAWEKTPLAKRERAAERQRRKPRRPKKARKTKPRSKPEPTPAPRRSKLREIGERLHWTTQSQRAAIFLTAPRSPERQKALEILLPEYLELRAKGNESAIVRALRRWEADGYAGVARDLRRAVVIQDSWGRVAFGSAILLMLLVVLIFQYLGGLG